MKRMRMRTIYEFFREEDEEREPMPYRKKAEDEDEEEEALALKNFSKIRRRRRHCSPILPALLFKPTSAATNLIKRLPPPSPDLRKSFPSMMTTTGPPTMPPPTVPPMLLRRSLIRQFADAVVRLAGSVTTPVAGTLDNVTSNNVGHSNRVSNNAAGDEDDYDAAKCVVGSNRTYCRNCRRYLHALVPLYE